MQSTLTGRSTPRRPQQRALHFSLLFGASGGVAHTDRHHVPFRKPDRIDAMVARRLVSDGELSRFGGDIHSIIDGGAALDFRAEGEE